MQGCAPTAKPLTVVVTDTCDTCQPTQINVHALAFSQYFNSDFSIGQVQTIWQQVHLTLSSPFLWAFQASVHHVGVLNTAKVDIVSNSFCLFELEAESFREQLYCECPGTKASADTAAQI